MSNIIPPLLSDSPPPIVIPDEEEDEFGDFNSAVDTSHVYESKVQFIVLFYIGSTGYYRYLYFLSICCRLTITIHTST